eukprot:c21269_g2_i1 orf=468-986(-)
MVGAFSNIPSLQLHSSFHTRNQPVSTILVLIIMLLLHPAVFQPMSAATPGTQASGLNLKRTASQIRQKLDSKENSQFSLVKKQRRANADAMPRFHRQLLANGASAGESSGTTDQAMRALVGSSPPKCVKKCGACTPCKSVLVPIHTNYQPEAPTEYYPEAWRCQCKGKIYNP